MPKAGALVWGVAVCGLLALPHSVRAQETTLSGSVTDSTDAVVPGVTVTALHTDTGNTFLGVSDASGNYRIGAMRPGVYKITAELPGFTTITRDNVQLLIGQTAVLNLKMTLASVSESITVSAQAPLIDVSQSKLGGNIDPKQLEALPVNGRNWMQLTMLAPGSRANDVGESPTGIGGTAGGGSTRGDPGYFQLILDGQQVTNTMAQATFGQPKFARDAIGEFQFVSGRFDATQGRSQGIVVNAVTKSGTNSVTGSGYGYFRDDKFIAQDFVAHRVLPYQNQQAGGTIGGPIVKDRTHFFGYYEAEREPASLIFNSPYPRFNIPDLSFTRIEHKAGVRLDEQISNNVRMMFRGNGWRNTLPLDAYSFGFNSASAHPSTLGNRIYENDQLFAALTQTFGSKAVNEIKGGFFLTNSDQYPLPGLGTSPSILLAGYSIGKQDSQPLRLNGHTWSIRDDFTTIKEGKGRHEIKFGGDFYWNHDFYEWNTGHYGRLQANAARVPADLLQSLFPVWNDPSTWNLAPLAPYSVRYTQSFAACSPVSEGCGWSWVHLTPYAAAWAQDNWTITPRLTLNAGIRWDLAYNWAANQYDVPPIRKSVPNDWYNFGPRLGFAYTLPDQRTVLRGGWGLYYIGPKDQWAHHTPINIQIANVAVLNDGRPDFAVNPFNGSITTYDQAVKLVHDTVGYIASDTDHVPYSQETSFGFQRQLGDTMSFQADYSWNAGRREQATWNTNLSYNPATGVNYPFSNLSLRPWPFLGITNQIFSAAQSNYHGLETAFSKRFSNHWQASATYTLASFRDLQPSPVFGAFPVAADIGDVWSDAEGAQRHRAVFNGIWDLPYDFEVSGLYFYGSGQVFSTSYGADLRDSGNAFSRLRPNGTIMPRNDVTGLPIHRVDLRFLRRFAIHGPTKVEASLEVFNIFNHVNYGNYVTAEANPLYRAPAQNLNTAYLPRMLQLGFRFTF